MSCSKVEAVTAGRAGLSGRFIAGNDVRESVRVVVPATRPVHVRRRRSINGHRNRQPRGRGRAGRVLRVPVMMFLTMLVVVLT